MFSTAGCTEGTERHHGATEAAQPHHMVGHLSQNFPQEIWESGQRGCMTKGCMFPPLCFLSFGIKQKGHCWKREEEVGAATWCNPDGHPCPAAWSAVGRDLLGVGGETRDLLSSVPIQMAW